MAITAEGLHHVGVSVRSLAQSLAFYNEVLGITPEFVTTSTGLDVDRLVGIDGAVIALAFLRVGDTVLELLEYKEPRGRDYDRRNCDVGAVHLALRVPDVDGAYEALCRLGVAVSGPPLRIAEGPLTGCATVYFQDVDGVQLEAFQDAPVDPLTATHVRCAGLT